ncbi:MAG: hypothetical protein M3Y59_23755 [Myxococcota bacterium]|nr:hypothetical protein [Myxococcota bacterium]
MSTPIRFSPLGVTPSLTRPTGSTGAGFASRMGGNGLGAALASGVQNLGRQVVQAATAGLPPVVQNLARGAVDAAGGALTGQGGASLEILDQTRFYVMMQSIFAAANMPTVDKQ